MGIVQELSGNTGATTSPTTFNATLPAPTTAGSGRYLVIVVACDNVVDTPPGFVVDEDQVNNAGHYVFRKSTANSESSWAITPGSGGGAAAWYAAELNELDASSPLDANAHTSLGTGSSGSTQSTGTTGTPTVDDLLMIASFSMSTSGETDVNADAFTNDYVERADQFTEKVSGTDIGLYVAAKEISAAVAQECTVTYSASGARTGIMVGYKIAAGGATHEIGRVTETETSRALTRSKSAAAGRVTETEMARALTRSKSSAVGRVIETETARALTVSGAVELGRVTEVETARTLTRSKSVALGRVTETETARALSIAGRRPPAGRVTDTSVIRRSVSTATTRRITS